MINVLVRLALIAGTIASLTGEPIQAHAMQFNAVTLGQNDVAIQAEGAIIPGDFDRLKSLVDGLPPADGISGIALNSPGGSFDEAEKLARSIRRVQLATMVVRGSRCVSACFLLFAAGTSKIVAPEALIGVHSASQSGGVEDNRSMAPMMMMARTAASLGVPNAIIGKIVVTKPHGVYRLTPGDLTAMGVVIFQTETASLSASESSPVLIGYPHFHNVARCARLTRSHVLFLERCHDSSCRHYSPSDRNAGRRASGFANDGRPGAECHGSGVHSYLSIDRPSLRVPLQFGPRWASLWATKCL